MREIHSYLHAIDVDLAPVIVHEARAQAVARLDGILARTVPERTHVDRLDWRWRTPFYQSAMRFCLEQALSEIRVIMCTFCHVRSELGRGPL